MPTVSSYNLSKDAVMANSFIESASYNQVTTSPGNFTFNLNFTSSATTESSPNQHWNVMEEITTGPDTLGLPGWLPGTADAEYISWGNPFYPAGGNQTGIPDPLVGSPYGTPSLIVQGNLYSNSIRSLNKYSITLPAGTWTANFRTYYIRGGSPHCPTASIYFSLWRSADLITGSGNPHELINAIQILNYTSSLPTPTSSLIATSPRSGDGTVDMSSSFSMPALTLNNEYLIIVPQIFVTQSLGDVNSGIRIIGDSSSYLRPPALGYTIKGTQFVESSSMTNQIIMKTDGTIKSRQFIEG